MTDDATLNRLIAERVMGKVPCNAWIQQYGGWFHPTVYVRIAESCGHTNGACYPVGHPTNYCTDPVAWGALFVWLIERMRNPQITGYIDDQGVGVSVFMREGEASDVLPGRALVLATLAAYGVEVEG